MNDREIPWLPADQAPMLTPLLCYWAPFPESEELDGRAEFWAVAVRRKVGDIDRWHMYQPLWEGGCGHSYAAEPDFFAPLGRPEGNPKWVTAHQEDEEGSLQEVVHLKGYNSPTPHKGGNSTVPLKVDGCGGEDDERR